MNMLVARTAAFVIGCSIAGCVYAAHSGARAVTSPWVAVFPGARQTAGDPGGDGADVDLHLAVVSLHMEAARYDTDAQPAAVVDFYKKALARPGRHVTVKRGGPHTRINGFAWSSAPDQTTVTDGDDIVAVKPLDQGTQFAIIRIVAKEAEGSPGH